MTIVHEPGTGQPPVVSGHPLIEGRLAPYRLVVRAVLSGWATNTGYKGRRPVRAALISLGIVIVLSNLGGIWALGSFRNQLPDDDAVAALSLLIVYMQAAGVVVLLQSIGLGQGMIARGLRLVPLTPAERAIAVNIPLLGIALVSVSTVAVPSVALLADIAAGPDASVLTLLVMYAQSAVIVTLVALVGACFGFLLWAGAATLADQVGFLSTKTYPMSIAALAFGASFHLPALGAYVDPDGKIDIPWPFELALVWPAATEAVVGSPASVLLTVAGAAIVFAAAGRTARALLPILLRPEPLPRRKLPWHPDGPFPLLRMELARLLRTRRIAAAWGSGFAMAFFGFLAAVMSSRRGQIDFDTTPLLGLIVAIPTGQIVLLARGYSARRYPYQLVVGHDPARWARAVQGAALLLAAAVAVPLIAFLVAYNGVDDGVVRVVAGFLACVYAGASVVGAITLAGRDNAAAEFTGSILVTVSAAVLATSLVARYDADALIVPAIQFTAAGALAVLPGWIERNRWAKSLEPGGIPAPT